MQQANTLILFCDQHNPFVSGCYGNENAHTPNIDRLAERGTVFENAYTPNPICVPARASFATGDYSFRNRHWDNCHAFDGAEDSWGKRLKENGVQVTTIGKLHFKDDSERTFPGRRIPMNVSGGMGDPLTALRQEGGESSVVIKQLEGAKVGLSDYMQYDRRIASEAADYLRKEAGKDGKTWCLYVGLTTPHNPLIVPQEFWDLYRPEQFSVAPEWHDQSGLHPVMQAFRHRMMLDRGLLTDEQIQNAMAAYYALTSFMDSQVGVILDALREAGLEESTRVIYMDDHGDCAGDHGIFFKCNMFEGSVHIPMVVAGPDIPRGQRIQAPSSIVDLYPTLLDFHQVQQTEEEQQKPGISLIEHIKGNVPYDRPIYSEYYGVGYAHSVFMLRKGDYKLVYFVGSEQVSLFDLKRDPGEQHDLGTLEKYQEKIAELKQALYKIADPEVLDRESLKDQQALFTELGGVEAILQKHKAVTPFTAVPEGCK